MSKLVVTTIALVFFSVVVEAIMPSSTLNKYIKAVFGLVILSVFIQTFVSFKDGFKLDYSNIYNSEMAYSINKLKVDTVCNNISYLLEKFKNQIDFPVDFRALFRFLEMFNDREISLTVPLGK